MDTTTAQVLEGDTSNDHRSQSSAEFESLYSQGIAAARKGDREGARAALLPASELEPGNPDVWMWLASISEYPEELLAFLKRVLDADPNNGRALEWHSATTSLLAKTLVQRAVAAHEGGSNELAVQCLDNALELDANCVMAWFWKASLAIDEDQKITYLEHVLELDPENAKALAVLGSIKSSKYDALLNGARTAAVTGNFAGGVEILDELLQLQPDNIEAWLLRSHFSSDLEAKLDSLQNALAVDPNNTAAMTAYEFLCKLKDPVNAEPSHLETEEIRTSQEPAESHIFVEEEAPVADTSAYEAQLDTEVELYDVHNLDVDTDEEVKEHTGEAEPTATDTEDPYAFIDENQAAEAVAEGYEYTAATLEVVAAEDHEPAATAGDESNEPDLEIFKAVTAEYDIPVFADERGTAESVYHVDFREGASVCPFCSAHNDAQAFECNSCHAMLTLSDLESLLGNPRVDHQELLQAVTKMEAEWNFRDFSEEELTSLGIGHLNLSNFEAGRKYLEEASRLSPNNVILSGQVRAVAIRIDELSHQTNGHSSMPKGKTILVVDDSPTVRKLISGKLEKSGHHVVCAEDGVEALARMEESLPDLVLLDITMPRMDGYEVCKHIRANPAAKDLPVVMISGKDGFFDKVRGRMAGTTGYVTKPFGPETLMKALETYLIPEGSPIG